MAFFIVSYDQHRDRDYTPVWTLLHNWKAVRVLESLWLVARNADSASIRDALRLTTHDEDSIVVIELKPGSEWSSFKAQAAGTAWLNQNIQRYQ